MQCLEMFKVVAKGFILIYFEIRSLKLSMTAAFGAFFSFGVRSWALLQCRRSTNVQDSVVAQISRMSLVASSSGLAPQDQYLLILGGSNA